MLAPRNAPRQPMGPVLSFLIFGPLAVLVIGGVLYALVLYQQREARQRFELTLAWADGAPQHRTKLDPAWHAAPSGLTPRIGDEVKTEGGARTVLTFDGKTSVRLSRNTTVRLDDVARGERLEIRLRLLAGRIWVDASPSEHVTVLMDAGEVSVDGRAVEIVVDTRASQVLAWQGRAAYAAVAGDPPRHVEQGQSLLLAMGAKPKIQKAPAQHDLWQTWNLQAQTRDLASGSLPAMVVAPPPPPPVAAPTVAAPQPRQTIDVVPPPVRPRAGVYRSPG